MKTQTLSSICTLRNELAPAESADFFSYISTENMIPNKGGVSSATNVPTSGKVKRFYPGDTLISNIRPYFKKIWLADQAGFCSNDVLIFKPLECSKEYLYWLLSEDAFFKYMMTTSKGTKMPRGDKLAIMSYAIPSNDISIQNFVEETLRPIKQKIILNNRINDYLEDVALAIFNNKFPHLRNGCSFVGDFVSPRRGKGLLSKDASPGQVPVVAGGLKPSTFHNVANTTAPVVTISASGANAGYINLWHVPVWASDSSFIDEDVSRDVYFWYVMLKSRQQEIFDSQTGSAQPHIYPKHIKELPIDVLESNKIHDYNQSVSPFFEAIGENLQERQKLEDLRDSLLPKLMSGEIDVSKVDIARLNNHLSDY